MADTKISDDLLNTMRRCDTPTICNAIEVAQRERGFAGFTKATMLCSAPDDGPIVGFARTAKIAGLNPPTEPSDVIRTRRIEYFRSMAAGPRPAIAVVEDVDHPHCIAAWWGEVHSAVHKGLGMAGALTNGVMRDLGDLEPGFPIIAGSIGPSHGFVHVREFGTRVEIFGLNVDEGDLVHADRHGAVVVPPDVIPRLGAAIENLLSTEQIILEPARRAGFDIETLEAAWAAFEKART
ncbi:MAG: RraA family protein [Gammaproteobacteria bacterium]|nr:RraA family protein [Gammaproteobacteria bacterium]